MFPILRWFPALLAVAATLTADAAEVVATCKAGHQAVNLTLYANRPGKRTAFSPDNSFDEQVKGLFRWSKVPDGEYRIIADPDFEDWDAHWIGVHTVVVKDGAKVETEFTIPDGSANFRVSFGKLTPPAQRDMDEQRVFRVERLTEQGRIDPFFRQWLWTKKRKDAWSGTVDYMAPGKHRITAFGVDADFQSKDGPSADIELRAADLEDGEVEVTLHLPEK